MGDDENGFGIGVLLCGMQPDNQGVGSTLRASCVAMEWKSPLSNREGGGSGRARAPYMSACFSLTSVGTSRPTKLTKSGAVRRPQVFERAAEQSSVLSQ